VIEFTQSPSKQTDFLCRWLPFMTLGASIKNSRLERFYQKSIEERLKIVKEWAALDQTDYQAIVDGGLTSQVAECLIENAIGVFSLPMGIATNFLINGTEHLVPMVIEEPSVIAACSFAAKLARSGGGFVAWADEPVMIGQIQTLHLPDVDAAAATIMLHQDELLRIANAAHPNLAERGGGARAIEARIVRSSAVGPMLIVHLLIDVRNAMGANIVNTAAEAVAPSIEALTGGRVLLRILSNLTDHRMAGARCRIPMAALATETLDGRSVAEGVVGAWAMADADPYRAATHNKGVMNGIDAVLLATGNDWRAIEAGAHAYAAREGRYGSLTQWKIEEKPASQIQNPAQVSGVVSTEKANGGGGDSFAGAELVGEIRLPMALGTVGGTTKAHPTARAAVKILGVQSAQELAGVVAAVGLAQNFSAIRALATEGIQKGHMRLHARKFRAA
jgi:hydroxymethylglutaryl-CoA reductase